MNIVDETVTCSSVSPNEATFQSDGGFQLIVDGPFAEMPKIGELYVFNLMQVGNAKPETK